MKKTKFSILTVTYNNQEIIKSFINNIEKEILNKFSSELIIIDNNSTDNTKSILKGLEKENIKIDLIDENHGYGAGINYGAKFAEGEYLIISNPDIEILKFNEQFFDHIDKKTGIVWGEVIENNKFKNHFKKFPTLFSEILHDSGKINNFLYNKFWSINLKHNEKFKGWGMGGFFIIKKNNFDYMNGFDDKFFLFKEETDLAKRLCDKDFHHMFSRDIVVKHLGGESVKSIDDKVKKIREKSNSYYYLKHDFPSFIFLYKRIVYLLKYLLKGNYIYKEIFNLYKSIN